MVNLQDAEAHLQTVFCSKQSCRGTQKNNQSNFKNKQKSKNKQKTTTFPDQIKNLPEFVCQRKLRIIRFNLRKFWVGTPLVLDVDLERLQLRKGLKKISLTVKVFDSCHFRCKADMKNYCNPPYHLTSMSLGISALLCYEKTVKTARYIFPWSLHSRAGMLDTADLRLLRQL